MPASQDWYIHAKCGLLSFRNVAFSTSRNKEQTKSFLRSRLTLLPLPPAFVRSFRLFFASLLLLSSSRRTNPFPVCIASSIPQLCTPPARAFSEMSPKQSTLLNTPTRNSLVTLRTISANPKRVEKQCSKAQPPKETLLTVSIPGTGTVLKLTHSAS
jgi:hypothetical protein